MMNGAGGGGGGERGMKIKYNSSNNCKCPLQLVSLYPGICPICHTHFNSSDKVPLGHSCGHTICKKCSSRIYYEAPNYITNTPLLSYLGLNYQSNFDWLEQDCVTAIYLLGNISLLLKSNPSTSRAMQRKILNLITSLSPNGQNRLIKGAKAVGERSLTEIFALSSHLSHYDAQQQLWCAIRSRACQYMGPAMQEEALKLVLLALEDGSPLSRKVLVMFVVQRLAPQFPQASKTSIGHVIQLLYRASCFDVLKRSEATSLMTLRPEFRSYDSLRTQHDSQIVKIALDSGIRFTPDQWSSILYGDTLHKSHMQSIIDKLQATQSFLQLTNEFFVSLQRSVGQREDSQLLLSLHPHFILLASTEVSEGGMSWSFVCRILEATSCVLSALFSLGSVQNNKLGHGQKGRAFERKKIRSEQGPSYASHEEQFENSCELSEIETKSVRELLNDARAVRKKIKDAQKLLPPIYAKCLEEEANGIEEEAAKMMTQLKLRGVETNQIF